MLLEDWERINGSALPFNGYGPARLDPVVRGDGRIFAAGRGAETVAEARMQGAAGSLIEVDIEPPPVLDEERAQVVDAVGMVGMGMGEEHGIEPVDLRVDELLAQIRRSIDQNGRKA
jgi:hypothetical protein